MPLPIPAYDFDFSTGVNWHGVYYRTAPHLNDGQPRQFRYAFSDDHLVLPLGKTLSQELADLIDVFAVVRIADARAPRVIPSYPPSSVEGSRRLGTVVGLRDPTRWNTPEIKDELEALLSWLTGDEWLFDFVPRTAAPRRSEAQLSLLAPQLTSSSVVRLHSGGLDSWLGLAASLRNAEADAVLAVSVISHPRIARLTSDVLAKTRSASAMSAPMLIGLHLGLHHLQSVGQFSERESSQRTRILACLAAGLSVATLVGSDELRVMENGVGAINLRNIPAQIGAMMNRATHPRTLHWVARIASTILDRPIRIVNDGLLRTKAELLSECDSAQFLEAITATASCERLPWYPAQRACGTCPSCILRRLAIRAAMIDELDDARHRELDLDLLSQRIDLASANAVPLLAMAEQAETLRRTLADGRPYEALRAQFSELIHLALEADALNVEPTDLEARVVRLYRRHLRDWDAFASAIPALSPAPSQLPLPLTPSQMAAAS